MSVEPVQHPGPFSDGLFPCVHEQLEVLRETGHGHRAQVRLTQRYTRDGEGIPGVALAGTSQRAALLVRSGC